MKKRFPLLLALVLCLWLCACGGPSGNAGSNETPGSSLPVQSTTPTSSAEPSPSAEPGSSSGAGSAAGSDASDAPVWAELVGSWNHSPTNSITINDDGTITYNDTVYTVEWPEEKNTGRMEVFASDGRWFDISPQEGCITVNSGNGLHFYFKDRNWTVVDITLDNFWDYFEYSTDALVEVDAWGELKSFVDLRVYALKAEYQEKLDEWLTDSTVSVKYTYDELRHYIVSVDIENQTYTAERADSSIDSDRYNVEATSSTYTCHGDPFHILVGTAIISPDAHSYLAVNHNLVDAIGTLYFVNK